MLPFWKICGFGLYVSVYMVYCEGLYRWPREVLMEACCKALPVVQCLLTVVSSNSEDPGFTRYSRRISLGLLLCAVGDMFIVWQAYKPIGAVLFMIAHLSYISAFRTQPLQGGAIFASYLIIGVSICSMVLPALPDHQTQALVAVYLVLVCAMAWRACVRFQQAHSISTLCALLGSLCFLVSDGVLLIDRFVWKESFKHAPALVMSTYYAAQLGIALSATDDYTPTYYDLDKTKKYQ